jgi:hypothetical protein
MRPLRRLVVVGATLALVAVLVPSVSAASPRSGTLHVTKECSEFTLLAGGFCTITSSDLPAIKAGMKVVYASPVDQVNWTLNSDIVLQGPGNNAAFGHVSLNLVTGLGVVTFSGGTGRFTGFTVVSVSVSALGGPDWSWEGPYSFSPAG